MGKKEESNDKWEGVVNSDKILVDTQKNLNTECTAILFKADV